MNCIEIARLRLDRAVEHIDQFGIETEAFFKGTPFGIEPQFYSDGERDCVSYHFRISQDIPQRLGIIAGECVHNLRAILDNIIWGLGEIYPPVHDKVSFPLADSPSKYKTMLEYPKFKGIKNFPPAAQTLIENLQPYNGGYAATPQKHFLSILDSIWNADKHRTPALMLAIVGAVDINGSLGIPGSVSAGPGIAVKNGAVFARGAVPDDGPKPDQYPKVSVHIALEVGQTPSVLAANYLLGCLHDFIRDEVVAKFEPIVTGGKVDGNSGGPHFSTISTIMG